MKFNEWSLERLRLGAKRLTSRDTCQKDDPDVEYCAGELPWKFIRDFLWRDEGAVSPAELKKVVNDIYLGIQEDHVLHVHVLKPEVGRG